MDAQGVGSAFSLILKEPEVDIARSVIRGQTRTSLLSND